jgi:diguanylate cyclase (GGDEF)-like protein
LIDIQTIILAIGIGNFGFALIMAGYMRGTAKEPGLSMWMWSRLVYAVTQIIGWLRPGPWADNAVGFGCVVGMALELSTYCIYFGFARWQRKLIPVLSAALLVMLIICSRGANYVQQLALTCAISALFAGAMAYILLRPRTHRVTFLHRMVGGNDAVFALALALGGWDGLVHPGHVLGSSPYHMIAALGGYLLMIVNGAGFLLLCKQKADEQMTLLATTDFLTGLANRRAFFEQAESARMLALRLRKPIALLMLDIDHFKQLNDRFGHATGDEALAAFGSTVRAALREHDIMGRLGGEEFALALPGTDLAGALLTAERLRQAMTDAQLDAGGTPYTLTVSVGAVLIEPHELLTEALARADHGLYAAKSAGRNRVEAGPPLLKRA